MVAVQIAAIVVMILFASYLLHLLFWDVVAFILNAFLIFYLVAFTFRMIRKDLDNLYIASCLVVLMLMLIFPFSTWPIWRLTWFLALSYFLCRLAWWAHRKGHVDLTNLVELKKKKR